MNVSTLSLYYGVLHNIKLSYSYYLFDSVNISTCDQNNNTY